MAGAPRPGPCARHVATGTKLHPPQHQHPDPDPEAGDGRLPRPGEIQTEPGSLSPAPRLRSAPPDPRPPRLPRSRSWTENRRGFSPAPGQGAPRTSKVRSVPTKKKKKKSGRCAMAASGTTENGAQNVARPRRGVPSAVTGASARRMARPGGSSASPHPPPSRKFPPLRPSAAPRPDPRRFRTPRQGHRARPPAPDA